MHSFSIALKQLYPTQKNAGVSARATNTSCFKWKFPINRRLDELYRSALILNLPNTVIEIDSGVMYNINYENYTWKRNIGSFGCIYRFSSRSCNCEKHPLAAKAKDIGSAAVFTCIILFALVWAGVIWSAKI